MNCTSEKGTPGEKGVKIDLHFLEPVRQEMSFLRGVGQLTVKLLKLPVKILPGKSLIFRNETVKQLTKPGK